MKRKMLRNSLQALYSASQIEAAMTGTCIQHQVRPQQLTFDEYVSLYKALHP